MNRILALAATLSLCASLLAEVTKSPKRGPKPSAAIFKLEQALFDRTLKPVRQLDIDLIMLGPDFAGTAPSEVSWAGDNSKLWFRWKRPGEKESGIYEVARSGGVPKRLSKDEEAGAPPLTADRDPSGRWAVYAFEGDIHLLDTHSGRVRKVTHSPEAESDPKFAAEATKVAFRRGDNLFLLPLEGPASLRQLTDLRAGKDEEAEKEEKQREGQRRFLKEQQTELFLTIQNKAEKEKEERERKRSRLPQPFYFEDRKVESLSLSPDGKYVVVEFSLAPKEQSVALIPDYLAQAGYTDSLKSRIKVGDAEKRYSLRVFSLEKDETFEVKRSRREEETPSTEPKPSAAAKQPGENLLDAVWSKQGHRLLATARSTDSKNQWLWAVDVETRDTRVLHHQTDDAWVLNQSDSGFFDNDRRVWFRSEHTGFLHLYSAAWEGASAVALTEGKFEVSGVRLSEDRETFYFHSNQEGPEVVHFYSLSAAGGPSRKLSEAVGNHAVTLSPDGKFLADVYSFSNKPWELCVQPRENPKHRQILTDSPTAAFRSYPWIEPKLVKIVARDGTQVPARLYLPSKPHGLRPAVIFVHGAGYLQNVHRWWSQYYREYMFHHFLMEQGYTVLDVDYRGSAGYGRDWRTAIYQHMGGRDLDDQVDAAAYLVAHHGAHPDRIGIYGGSYGGFITLMALFTAPRSFGAGAALRPVTDWAHYNQGYTSNILNLPQNDEEAYRRSSPIYFAEGLEDPLLICHGLVDVNVHAQDTVRLAQRLIELRKQHFEVMLYPVEDHGFQQASSWADEYKRIFRLFEQTLKRQ